MYLKVSLTCPEWELYIDPMDGFSLNQPFFPSGVFKDPRSHPHASLLEHSFLCLAKESTADPLLAVGAERFHCGPRSPCSSCKNDPNCL